MNSKIEFRDAPPSEIRIPREVYYRCLWTVKDSRRLAEIVRLSDSTVGDASCIRAGTVLSETLTSEYAGAMLVSEETAARAGADLRCISSALAAVPEVYREGLLDNIIDKTPFSDFAHPNTWKRWKLVFIHELARELRLI